VTLSKLLSCLSVRDLDTYDRTDLRSLVRYEVVVGFGAKMVSRCQQKYKVDSRDSAIHDILLGLDHLG
jgi:hypothetical protein